MSFNAVPSKLLLVFYVWYQRERHGDWRERHGDWRLDSGANEYSSNMYVSIPYLSFEDSTSIVQTILRYYYALSNKALTVELLNVR